MLKALLFTLIIVAVSVAFLSVKLLVKKKGTFPNTHIGHSAAMRRRGIRCVQSMDFAERLENPRRINERSTKRNKQ